MEAVLGYRGREVTQAEVAFIRELLASDPHASRRAVSRKLCEAWGWVQPNGAPRDMVCRGLLLALERAGHIELPPPRWAAMGRAARGRRPPSVEIDRTPVRGRLGDLGALEFHQVRRTGEEALFEGLIEAHHYPSRFKTYLSEDEARKVLRCYQRDIARFIHAQMQEHYWEEAVGYEVRISKGFTELKPSAYSAAASEAPMDFRASPADKSNMAKYLFGGFQRCLYAVQKFQSDAERKLAVILDREALKWFKPAKGQFQIFYRNGSDQLEYQPDFVAETTDTIYMLEPKARNELDVAEVQAKKAAAVRWCGHASNHAASYNGKSWRYVLIPHDGIAENMTLVALGRQFGVE